LCGNIVKARPTGAGLELGPRVEERLAAYDAAIRSLAVVIPVRAGERTLRLRLLGDRVLDRAEVRAAGFQIWRGHFRPMSMSLCTANVVAAIWNAAMAAGGAVRSLR